MHKLTHRLARLGSENDHAGDSGGEYEYEFGYGDRYEFESESEYNGRREGGKEGRLSGLRYLRLHGLVEGSELCGEVSVAVEKGGGDRSVVLLHGH